MISLRVAILLSAATLVSEVVLADGYSDTVDTFKKAGSAWYFDHSYGYAVFPSIGKGGLIIGGAHGTGRVYQNGQYVGDTSMTQVSIGRRSRSPLRPLSLRMMSRADFRRAPRDWAVVALVGGMAWA